MNKSHVSMEQHMCIVTGKPYGTGTILLDRRLKDSMERNTITGNGISPEVQEKFDEGYLALIGIDESKSEVRSNGNINPEDAYRTGEVVYLKEKVF